MSEETTLESVLLIHSQKTAFIEWLMLHQGATELDQNPDWVWQHDDQSVTGAPYFRIHVYNRHDGRSFTFSEGIYSRATTRTPWNFTLDWSVHRQLHLRYPEEYPEAPSTEGGYWEDGTWDPQIYLDAALGALLEGKIDQFVEGVVRAAVRMGAKPPERLSVYDVDGMLRQYRRERRGLEEVKE